ncbi:V-type sodium ATPase subunit E [Enterococcus hirae]|uniref:V-type sodium ATPase subunit E n=1 Tax=Enterococcus hirae TaxID=1354 RepID=UPI0039820A1D
MTVDAIDKIITQINETAQLERASFEEMKRKEIDQKFEVKKWQIEADFQKEKASKLEEIERSYRQLRNKQKMQVKQEILNVKQEVLQRLFTEATLQLENEPKEEQLALMKQMIQTLPINGTARLIPGEKSADILTSAVIAEWNEELPFELIREDFTEKAQAGLIIDDAGIQYNFLFSHLIKEIQETMSAEIAKELFD